MKTIDVRISMQDQNDREEFLKKAKAAGLNDLEIGNRLCEKLGGGNARALATQYGSFRNGQRPLNKKIIPGVADILGIPQDLLCRLNAKSNSTQMLLQFDTKLPFRDFLGEVPDEITTLDKFLVWLSTEAERRFLMSQL